MSQDPKLQNEYVPVCHECPNDAPLYDQLEGLCAECWEQREDLRLAAFQRSLNI